MEWSPAGLVDPRGNEGIGFQLTASGEAGIGIAGVGATGAAGAGVFRENSKQRTSLGVFASGGVVAHKLGNEVGLPANTTGQPSSITGAGLGAGGGVWMTNAEKAEELRGPFDTTTLDIPLVAVTVSIQWAFDPLSDIWMASVNLLAGPGVSGSTYPTITAAKTLIASGAGP